MKSCINRKKSFVLSVCMAVLSITTQVAECETYGGGSGTAEDPYLIYTPAQMNAIGANQSDWSKHFKLMADIDLGSFGGADFNIIGANGHPFSGTFDGNSKRISNLNAALFGYIFGESAEIRNLGLVNPNTRGLVGLLISGRVIGCYVEGGSISGSGDDDIIGGLVSYVVDGTISNCYSSASVSGGIAFVGGLVGYNDGGTILNCYSSGNVSGGQQVGGLIGMCKNGTVSQSYSTGNVTCYAPQNTGGFVGYVRSSTVENCYATGRVKSKNYAAGFVAVCDEEGDGPTKILNSYSIGRVIADEGERAGFLGYRAGGTVKGCFWDRQSSGVSWSHAGTGKTTAQMQTKSTFTSAGWDFTMPIWFIDEGNDYPRLWWENTVPAACIVGGDRTVEVGSGCEARVTLDGSCSSDEDSTPGTNDDINDFDWFEVIDPCDPNSDIFLGTGEIIECNLPLGEHIIILEVTDKADAFDANEVTITVEDTTPPEISCPGDITVAASNPAGKVVTFTAMATDLCDSAPEVTCSPAPESMFPCGATEVICTATDSSGNSSSCTFTVTVIEPIESQLWVSPWVINRSSRMKKIMAIVKLPEGISRDDIDEEVKLLLYPAGFETGGIAAMRQYIVGGRGPRHRNVRILAFFDRDKFTDAVPEDGKIEVYVTGRLKSGQYFYGSDIIWIRSWRWRRRWPWYRW